MLKRRWVPLFVRSGEAAPAGNQDLIAQGALPFPAEVPEEGLAQMLASVASNWAAPAGAHRKGLVAPAPSPAADDLFPLVWPHLAERLEKWSSHEELARHLCIDVAQLRAWIDRAAGLGLLRAGMRLAGSAPEAEQIRFEV